MNETHTIATKETEKNGHKRAALSQFISPGNCYSSPWVFCTQCPPLELNYSLKFLSRSRPSFVSFPPPGAAFFLSRSSYPSSTSLCRHFAPSEPIYSQSLAHYVHAHQSRFRFAAERSWDILPAPHHLQCGNTDGDCWALFSCNSLFLIMLNAPTFTFYAISRV